MAETEESSSAMSVCRDLSYISEGDRVILRKDRNMQCVALHRKRKYQLERMYFFLDGIIGKPYGSTFEVKGTKLTLIENEETEGDQELNSEQGKDNRNLRDTSDNQRLSHDQIEAMRKKGVGGEAIIDHLVENSATFQKKTEFAQQKYLKRKKKKHLNRFTVYRPSTRLIAEMYFNKGPYRICSLRMDSLGQILTWSNARAHNRMLVFETCMGLVVGACMERMGGYGTMLHVHTGPDPVRSAIDAYGFPENFYQNLHHFPLHNLQFLTQGGTTKKDTQSIPAAAKPEGGETKRELEEDHTEEPATKKLKVENGPIQGTNSDATHSPTEQQEMLDKDSSNPETKEENPIEKEELHKGQKDEEDVQKEDSQKEDTQKEDAEKEDSPKEDAKKEDTQKEDAQKEDAEKEDEDEDSVLNDREELKKERIKYWEEKKVKRVGNKEPRDVSQRNKEGRTQKVEAAKQQLLQGNFDSLIVVGRPHPTPIVLALLDYVLPSRPIAIFCQNQEPLMDCYMKLRDRTGVANLRLTETWCRNYQVLPNRTHPEINMHNKSGYLLTGITTTRDTKHTADTT